jgi:hypothetical protein
MTEKGRPEVSPEEKALELLKKREGERRQAFLREYEELCKKHKMRIEASITQTVVIA